jgi:hypothetical protein
LQAGADFFTFPAVVPYDMEIKHKSGSTKTASCTIEPFGCFPRRHDNARRAMLARIAVPIRLIKKRNPGEHHSLAQKGAKSDFGNGLNSSRYNLFFAILSAG